MYSAVVRSNRPQVHRPIGSDITNISLNLKRKEKKNPILFLYIKILVHYMLDTITN